MRLFCNNITAAGQSITLYVAPNDTIQEVKNKLFPNLSAAQIIFISYGEILSNDKRLSDYHIQMDGSCHFIVQTTKIITKHGTTLYMVCPYSPQEMCSKFNIPIDRQQNVKQDSIDSNSSNFATYYLDVIAKDNEIAICIKYWDKHDRLKFVFIKKDEALYTIGDRLGFYPPFHKNNKDDFELTHNGQQLDVYKTPNDYKNLLTPEILLNASIAPKPKSNLYGSTRNQLLVSGYIRNNELLLKLFVPDSIVQVCYIFYKKEIFLFGIGGDSGLTMLNVYSGKRFKMKKLSSSTKQRENPSIFDNNVEPFGFCTANNIKMPKSLYVNAMDMKKNYGSCIFHCGGAIKGKRLMDDVIINDCKLIVYDTQQLNNTKLLDDGSVGINAFEINMPTINLGWGCSSIYNTNNNSFCLAHGDKMFQLSLDKTEDLKWNQIQNLKLMKSYKVSLLCEDNHLFVIGGRGSGATDHRTVRKYTLDETVSSISLPDIPIDRCEGRQSAYISIKNQIAVGYNNVNILDINACKWQQYAIDNHLNSSFMWIDETNPDIIFMGTDIRERPKTCIVWIDIRESNPKWHSFWKSTVFSLMYGTTTHDWIAPYSVFPNY